MPVEVKSLSRAKAMLIALGVLLVGLALIFGIKHMMAKADKAEPQPVATQD